MFKAHHNNSHNHNHGGNNSEPLGKALFVCRSLHEGVWITGVQLQGDDECLLSLHNVIKSYQRYDLLENVNNAGKVSWAPWSTYKNVPVGTATTGTSSMYVARYDLRKHNEQHSRRRPHYTHRIGVLNSLEGMGMIFYAMNVSRQLNFTDEKLFLTCVFFHNDLEKRRREINVGRDTD